MALRDSSSLILIMILFLLAGTSGCREEPPQEAAADLILHNGRIYDLDPQVEDGTALAIQGDRILEIGSDEAILSRAGPGTRLVDLEGRAVLPGLIDSHLHFSSIGKMLENLQVQGLPSPEAVVERVKAAAEETAEGTWILGRGWDQSLWDPPEFPTAAMLDTATGDHPVSLRRVDGHALWANSVALKMAGVTAETPDPEGGRIVRNPETGEPTGVFVDRAETLIRSKIPPASSETLIRWIQKAGESLLRYGVTSVQDAGVDAAAIDRYRAMVDEGSLPIRVYAMLGDSHVMIDDYFEIPPLIDYGDHRYTFRAIKLGSDGALGSRGAALLAPYSDRPEQKGHLTMASEKMEELARQAMEKGYQVAIHAIGDRGNRMALDALQKALAESRPSDPRARIEHAQVLALEDLPRFGALGIIAAVQPIHATDDMHMAGTRIGEERLEGAYAWRSLLEASASLAFGSDAPFTTWNPWEGLQATVTRQNSDLQPMGGWRPQQRLSRETALMGYTLGAAFAAFEERDKGTLTPGKLADLVVLDRDYFEVPEDQIARITPVMTVLGGKIVFENSPTAVP